MVKGVTQIKCRTKINVNLWKKTIAGVLAQVLGKMATI